MTFIKVIILLFLSDFIGLQTYAQAQQDNHNDELFELCIGPGVVQTLKEHNTQIGFDCRILKQVSERIPMIIGVGTEHVINNKDWEIETTIGFSLFDKLEFLLSPQITTNKKEIFIPSASLEIECGFALNKHLKIGPSIEYEFSKTENNISLGIAIMIDFFKK